MQGCAEEAPQPSLLLSHWQTPCRASSPTPAAAWCATPATSTRRARGWASCTHGWSASTGQAQTLNRRPQSRRPQRRPWPHRSPTAPTASEPSLEGRVQCEGHAGCCQCHMCKCVLNWSCGIMRWQLHTCYAIGQLNEQHSTVATGLRPMASTPAAWTRRRIASCQQAGCQAAPPAARAAASTFQRGQSSWLMGALLVRASCRVLSCINGNVALSPFSRHLRYWAEVLGWANSQMYHGS